MILQADPTEVVVDLFALGDSPPSSIEKWPYTDDPDIAKLVARMTEKEQFELAQLCSKKDEEGQRSCELKWMMGVGPSEQVIVTKETT